MGTESAAGTVEDGGGADIHVAGVILPAWDGTILTVRKQRTRAFMLAGGKLEPGESAREAAVREVREELGLELHPADLAPLGAFTERAANEPGRTVLSQAFVAPSQLTADVRPQAELTQLRPQPVDAHAPDLAPLLSGHILPAVRADRIYHAAVRAEWEQAVAAGAYARSTRGASTTEVGYLHACSSRDQLGEILAAFYDDVDVVVLELSRVRLELRGLEVRVEPGVPGGSELYPHVYGGAIPLDCVVGAR